MNYSIKMTPDHAVVTLKGPINEAIELMFESLAKELKTRNVRFDLDGVTYINSLGVRGWRVGLMRLNLASCECFNCPSPVIIYANLVGKAFLCNSTIGSFYISYLCRSCGNDFSIKIESVTVQEPEALLEHLCPQCGDTGDSAIDCDFFAFLQKPA